MYEKLQRFLWLYVVFDHLANSPPRFHPLIFCSCPMIGSVETKDRFYAWLELRPINKWKNLKIQRTKCFSF